MGTRHLIAVIKDGEPKIAQYGQWDGYPEGQGSAVLAFLSEAGNIDKLKERLKKVRFLDHEGKDKEFIESYNKNTPEWSNQPDNRTPEQIRWWKVYQSRDLGADILSNVINSIDDEIVLRNSYDFAADSLMCEGVYLVDLDKNTFESYQGFNKEPLSDGERFKDLPLNDKRSEFDDGDGNKYKYNQVKHVVTFPLDNLPSEKEYLAAFPNEEDED
jgi:hypothetical protein